MNIRLIRVIINKHVNNMLLITPEIVILLILHYYSYIIN